MLYDNARNPKHSDMLSERVVGKRDSVYRKAFLFEGAGAAVIAAGFTAGAAAPAITVAVASLAPIIQPISVALVSGIIAGGSAHRSVNLVFGSFRIGDVKAQTKVTKINHGKPVKADSEGVSEEYKDKFQGYQDLDLKYKDILYDVSAGQPHRYLEGVSRVYNLVDEINDKNNISSDDVSTKITSFVSGGSEADIIKSKTAFQKLEESRHEQNGRNI